MFRVSATPPHTHTRFSSSCSQYVHWTCLVLSSLVWEGVGLNTLLPTPNSIGFQHRFLWAALGTFKNGFLVWTRNGLPSQAGGCLFSSMCLILCLSPWHSLSHLAFSATISVVSSSLALSSLGLHWDIFGSFPPFTIYFVLKFVDYCICSEIRHSFSSSFWAVNVQCQVMLLNLKEGLWRQGT